METVRRCRAVAVALVFTLASCSADNRVGSTSPSSTTTVTTTTVAATTTTIGSTTTTEPIMAMTDIEAAGGAHFKIGGGLDWLLVVGGVAWGMGDAPVTRIDASGNVLGTTTLPGSVCLAPDQGFGSVWAASCGSPNLLRLNPVTGAIQATIPLPVGDVHPEGSVGVSGEAVWAISADEQTLVKVDPISNTVTGTYPAPKSAVAVRGGFGSLWITAPTLDTLYRVDPNDARVTATIKVASAPRFLTVGGDAVWTLNQGNGTVSHVDPATNIVKADIPVDTGFVEGGDIAAGGGAVWARVTTALSSASTPPPTP